MTAKIKINHILNLVSERDLSHVSTVYFDTNGRARGKQLHTSNLTKSMDRGTAINTGIFSLAPDETQMQSSTFMKAENQFRDALVWLDPESCRDFPLDAEGRGLILIGQLTDEHKVYCPRTILHQQLELMDNLKLTAYGSFEYECYLLDETEQSARSKLPDQLKTHPGFEKMYGFTNQVNQSVLFEEIINACEMMEIPIDTIHTEFQSLLEAALKPQQGINIADNAALFKTVVKSICMNHGVLASFMARRNMIDQGCGAHINLSLLDNKDTEPVFFDDNAEYGISESMKHFIGGLQKYTPELFLLMCPNINSFRRLVPDLFAPLSNTWGINNKTVAFRVVNIHPEVTRIECRIPGADVNPYLSLAGLLLAGRLGIVEKCEPAEPIEGDGWSVASPNGLEFPLDFQSAINKFDQSALARKTFGDLFVDDYLASRRWQIDTLMNTVTDWEMHTFIEGA